LGRPRYRFFLTTEDGGAFMPSKADIANIKVDFSRQYGLDLSGIHRDAATLRSLVADAAANSNVLDYTNCYSYDGKEAVVPDLETAAFSSIPVDTRLSARRVELNLDEAIRYSQSCLQLRQQYGELARLRNDTRFKGEEFVRLDEVHKQEIDAGLYQLPWQEAADEKTGFEAAVAQAQIQQSIPTEMMQGAAGANRYAALLSDAQITNNVNSNAYIVRNVANSNKDQVGVEATSTSQYRSGIELATWLETSAAAKSNFAQLNAQLSIAARKEQYFRKDEGFRTARDEISRQIAWLQIQEHCRTGSILNYDERIGRLKILFDQNLQCVIERIQPLVQGLKDYYKIDIPLVNPSVGSILDDVSSWLLQAQNELAKYMRLKRLTIFSKWSGAASSSGDSFTANVDLVTGDGPSGEFLVRGVAFEYVGQNARPITLKVVPPANAWLEKSGNPLTFGRVYPINPSPELKPQHSNVLWNGSATGSWKITGEFESAAGSIDKLVMHLWVLSD
jgi:hypothetical protein